MFAHIGGIAFGFLAVKLFQSADAEATVLTFEDHVRAALDELPP